jgi:uncharacterized membrane protein YbhN (UPF0104 family)
MNQYQPYAPPGAAAGPPMAPYASSSQASVSELALEMLRQTRPWVLFLGILSFVASALMLLVGVGVAIMGLVAASATKSPAAALLGFVYIPLGLVYIYPGLKLVKYGSAIGRLLETRAGSDLEDALLQQKSMWKFSGISAIVIIVLYILLFVVMIGVGVSGAMKGFAP